MTPWRIHFRAETVSTNLDARAGRPGDVFAAGYQTAGRGRLDHRWSSPPGTNLLMSAVVGVAGLAPETVATLPLAVGLAVAEALSPWAPAADLGLKWPNDVLANGRKLAGILCERADEAVIAGIGVNVGRQAFAPELAGRATALAALVGPGAAAPAVEAVRERVLATLAAVLDEWRAGGLAAIYPRLKARDALAGRFVRVRQTDADRSPVGGISGGIRPDGALDVAGAAIWAGEAHVEEVR